MIITKTNLIVFLVGAFLGLGAGFFTGKTIYDRPLTEKIERDTVTIHDTIHDIAPHPKDSIVTKWKTKWLPAKADTVGVPIYIDNVVHDSVLVQVPISSKHYGNETYDAWISGFEPNLDSIKVYQKTEYITTTITKTKQPSKVSLDAVAGIDYNTTQQIWHPYAVGELTLNSHRRLSLGVNGGVIYNTDTKKAEPLVGGKIKLKIF